MTAERHALGLDRARVILARAGAQAPSRDVAEFRATLRLTPELTGPVTPVASVEDVDADGVLARRYDPAPGTTGRAVLLYLHGGAFVRGTLDAADPVCRRIAAAADCVVLSVDYRLAPEHPFPAALEDAEHVLDWTVAHAHRLGVDANRVAVGGDSAGATIATTVARRNAERVCLQVLLCGLFDLTGRIEATGRGADELDVEREQRTLDWIASLYLPGPTDALDPDASPLLVADHTGSPEAIVVSAELDPFAAQTREYVNALRGSRVPVTFAEFAGLPHAFTNFGGVFPEALVVTDVVAAGIRRVGSPVDGRAQAPDDRRARDRGATPSRGSDLRGAAPTHRLGPLA